MIVNYQKYHEFIEKFGDKTLSPLVKTKINDKEGLAVIDSGADYVTLPKVVSDGLGLETKPGKKPIGVVGGTIPSNWGKIPEITIEDKINFKEVTFSTSEKLNFIILGIHPLFSEYKITIDSKNKQITFEELS